MSLELTSQSGPLRVSSSQQVWRALPSLHVADLPYHSESSSLCCTVSTTDRSWNETVGENPKGINTGEPLLTHVHLLRKMKVPWTIFQIFIVYHCRAYSGGFLHLISFLMVTLEKRTYHKYKLLYDEFLETHILFFVSEPEDRVCMNFPHLF